MVCDSSDYQIHHYADTLKNDNFVLYYIKWVIFYCKMWLDHFMRADHVHEIDPVTGDLREANFEDWVVSPWENTIRDVIEVLLWIALLLAAIRIVLHLWGGWKGFIDWIKLYKVTQEINRKKIE
jgi:hypothetical protein